MQAFTHTPQKTLSPQEQSKKKGRSMKRLAIGVLKAKQTVETRVLLTPQGVTMLTEAGHEVIVEENAGCAAGFTDLDYAECGARLSARHDALQQDIVLTVNPLCSSDVENMKKRTLLFSLIRYHEMNRETIVSMHAKGLTAVALDWIEGMHGERPVSNSMKEIEGSVALVLAASLSAYPKGKGAMLGSVAGVSPSEVVILGAGMAGRAAAASAIGMGATIKIFDSSLHALQKMRHLFGNHIFTSVLHPSALAKALKSAEVIIGALGEGEALLPFVISEEMIKILKNDAVIIDLNIDKGGSFETSRKTSIQHPTYKDKGVHYCCLPSLTTLYPRTSSIALSNIIAPLLMQMNSYENKDQYICSDFGFQKGIYMYNGVLSNFDMGRRYNISAKDLQLLLTAF